MLFQQKNSRSYSNRINTFKTTNATPGARQRAIVTRVPHSRPLPEFIRKLDILCKHPTHPLPCLTKFSGWGTTYGGNRYASYVCQLCGTEQGWGLDHKTGEPLRLFSKPPKR